MNRLQIPDPKNPGRIMSTEEDFKNLWKLQLVEDENDPNKKFLKNKDDVRNCLFLRNPWGILIKKLENGEVEELDPEAPSFSTK